MRLVIRVEMHDANDMNQPIKPSARRLGTLIRRTSAHLLLATCLTAAGPAIAQTFEDGRAAYKRDDFTLAFKIFHPLAERGDARAQFSLGILYDEGEGLPADAAKAAYWYRKAAEQGHREAQFNVGQMYSVGHGVAKDLQQAYFWWILASGSGDEEATNNRDRAGQQLPPAEREKIRAEAARWKPRQP
ncbi:MAG: sel1 repeat family protein [Betaproteobacteria bacterium]|nr:sel1 repeat family protein [Betaproteobacteria bacterium]